MNGLIISKWILKIGGENFGDLPTICQCFPLCSVMCLRFSFLTLGGSSIGIMVWRIPGLSLTVVTRCPHLADVVHTQPCTGIWLPVKSLWRLHEGMHVQYVYRAGEILFVLLQYVDVP